MTWLLGDIIHVFHIFNDIISGFLNLLNGRLQLFSKLGLFPLLLPPYMRDSLSKSWFSLIQRVFSCLNTADFILLKSLMPQRKTALHKWIDVAWSRRINRQIFREQVWLEESRNAFCYLSDGYLWNMGS